MIRNNWGELIKAKARQRRVKAKAVALPTELEDELIKIRALAPPPSDDLIYKYLRGVYRLWHKVESSPKWKTAIQEYHKAHRLRIKRNYIRLIIQLTAADHVTDKMKHKYLLTLDLASQESVKPVDVIAFSKKHGGINKCVKLWNERYGGKSRKKPRSPEDQFKRRSFDRGG